MTKQQLKHRRNVLLSLTRLDDGLDDYDRRILDFIRNNRIPTEAQIVSHLRKQFEIGNLPQKGIERSATVRRLNYLSETLRMIRKEPLENQHGRAKEGYVVSEPDVETLEQRIHSGHEILQTLRQRILERDYYTVKQSNIHCLTVNQQTGRITVFGLLSAIIRNIRDKEILYPINMSAESTSVLGPKLEYIEVNETKLSPKSIIGGYSQKDADLISSINKTSDTEVVRVTGRIKIPPRETLRLSYGFSLPEDLKDFFRYSCKNAVESLYLSIFYPKMLQVTVFLEDRVFPTSRENMDEVHRRNISQLESQKKFENQSQEQHYMFRGLLPSSTYIIEWRPTPEKRNLNL